MLIVSIYTLVVILMTLCLERALIGWWREVRLGYAWYRFSLARRAAHKKRGGAV